MTRTLLLALSLLPAFAFAGELPSYLTLPAGLTPDRSELYVEEWGEAIIQEKSWSEETLRRGAHWKTNLKFAGISGDLDDNGIWALIKARLLEGGWTVVKEFDQNPFSATVRYQKNGKDTWALFTIFGASHLRLRLIEVGPQPLKFDIPPPAATPEKIADDKGDIPYLPGPPGSKAGVAARYEEPFFVPVFDEKGGEKEELVSRSTLKRFYAKESLSNVQFITLYKEALEKAGWKLIRVRQGPNQSDAVLHAHYAKNGRNIWAYLRHANGESRISIADIGGEDLATQLGKDCRVALYGVLFDFDKATLKPESDPVLTKARDALKANAKLAIEVQGHTDNVGADDYNLKLSESRAQAVLQWLVKNGIPASQLSSQGYGKNQPIADNKTDDGRAKNRRVELACKGRQAR